MSAAAVAALGVAVVSASGYVWYVPALVDLRAGQDRPESRRMAAAACVTGWGAAAAVAVLLLAGAPWRVALSAAALGGGVSAALRIRSALCRRREAAEEVLRWAALLRAPHAGPHAGPGTGPDPAAATRRSATWAAAGLGTATALAVAVILALATGSASP
ncbi:hypothetical protein [Streptomyces sp. TRM49041]|uniref:hypothetical protein n=1 Tax=Streptomyces sp. TRM49041 TaxID=2603216 RepID=UPI0011F016A8|nr:hypothetical protein [Streptomyces sp. TRM49041]